jgi:hypothetical protein
MTSSRVLPAPGLLIVLVAGALLACQPSGSTPEPASGGPAAAEDDARLEALLDNALRRFGESTTDESRRSARELLSAIVAEARSSAGCESCTELTVLERMLDLPPSDQLSFEQAARFAVADIGREELYEERS